MRCVLARVLGGICLALTLAAIGCGTPQEDFVRGSRIFYDYAAPALSAYIEADPALNPQDRADRKRPIEEYRLLLEEAERQSGLQTKEE